MLETKNTLVQTIGEIGPALHSLDPHDRDSLVSVGAMLEEAIPQVPEEHAWVRRNLDLCLQGLQALYHGNTNDRESLAQAVAGIAAATVEVLATDGEVPRSSTSLREASRRLSRTLGLEPGESGQADDAATATGDDTAEFSLDEAATLLVQLEPDDTSELTRLGEALHQLAAQKEADGSRYSPPILKLIDKAAQIIRRLVRGKAAHPASALEEVGALIEQAMQAAEIASEESAEGARSKGGKSPGGEPAAEELPARGSEPPGGHPSPARQASPVTSTEPAGAGTVSEDSASSGPVTLPSDADPGLVAGFLEESREYMDGAEAALLTLETQPTDTEAINTVFRAFHTIKGTSAFLGLGCVSELAHRAESLLSRVRDAQSPYTTGTANLALRSVDMLKGLMTAVECALEGKPAPLPAGYDALFRLLADPEAAAEAASMDTATERSAPLGGILVAQGKIERDQVEAVAAGKGDRPMGEALVRSQAASLQDVATALRTQQRMKGSEPAIGSSVRVRTDRLDRLIDMVGELVIAQSMVSQDRAVLAGDRPDLVRKVGHSGKIVRELQDLSMSMRMVPFRATFQKMKRLVRDLCQKSGKSVALLVEGEDTEIDRNMVDVINDPLVHMLRNAVDHGIEPVEAREKTGKPPTGTIRLAAYHSGGNVVVELEDDGRGLDREKIWQKAIAKGLVEPDKALSDTEIFQLIFAPGFSTAEKLTEVSGRGVGMDVVKRGAESLRGHIDIASAPGQGSTFTLRLPLTLAITDGMLVLVGSERFIIPTINISMSFRPDRQALATVSGRGELVRLRDEWMPMFRLHRLFNVSGAVEDPTSGLLVVVGDGHLRCALLVDELQDQQQVVAKSLGPAIGKIQGVSGGAILGDGRVGLILDPLEIATLARGAVGAEAPREGQLS